MLMKVVYRARTAHSSQFQARHANWDADLNLALLTHLQVCQQACGERAEVPKSCLHLQDTATRRNTLKAGEYQWG